MPMKLIITINLLLSFFLFNITSSAARSPWRPGEKQVKISFSESQTTQEVLDILMVANRSGMNINYEEGYGFVRCYVTPAEFSYLTESGLTPETEIHDLNAFSASFGTRGVPSGYYTVDELNEIADSLAENFPAICTKHLIGTASSGDPLYALKISDNSAEEENEPELMFDGGIHGDEVGGPENLIRFARDLCLEYQSNSDITYAVDNAETWIIYTINPYGRNNMTRYNANGVDINRDCGYMWNGEGNSSGAFSQAETKVIRDMLRKHQMVVHISYHSGTEYISYPWSYRPDFCADDVNHEYLAQQYAQNSGYSSIPYGAGYSGMYAINGSTKDFGYGATGAISWSMEISMSKQPPASQIVPYYLKNKNAMLSMITNSIDQGIGGTITDSETGEPVTATIFVSSFYPVNTNTETGDYHKFLVPGTYTLRIEANGYIPQVMEGVAVSSGLQTIIDASITPGGGFYGSSLAACYIPNNNFTDEGNTPAVTGAPDNVAYSLGKNGYVVIDMGTAVLDRTGNDVKVFENNATPEGYKVYGANTPDGPWFMLGIGSATTSFDLGSTILVRAQYLKITDDGDGTSQSPDAGYDLDAIENLHPDTLTVGWINGIVYNDQPPLFTIPGAVLTVNGNQCFSDENGAYAIASVPGFVEITGIAPYYEDTDTVMVTLGDTLNHDMHLKLTEGVNDIKSHNTFRIFPVPAEDHFMIEGPEGAFTMEIFNSIGIRQDKVTFLAGSEGHKYLTKSLKSGLYIVVISDESGRTVLKLVIK